MKFTGTRYRICTCTSSRDIEETYLKGSPSTHEWSCCPCTLPESSKESGVMFCWRLALGGTTDPRALPQPLAERLKPRPFKTKSFDYGNNPYTSSSTAVFT